MNRKLHKKFYKTKRQFITLIEIMIVMFLIALITGALAYNFRGSLDEGKAFKSKTGMEKVEMILNLRVAEDPSLMDSIESSWQEVIRRDPLVKDSKSLIHDGWGQPYTVTVEENIIKVRSPKYLEYKKSSKSSR